MMVGFFRFDNQHVVLLMKNNYKIVCKMFYSLGWIGLSLGIIKAKA